MTDAAGHHHRLTRSIARRHLIQLAIRVVAYSVLGVLVLKLAPGLESAVESLAHVSWAWLLAAVALEVASEWGYVVSWRAMVDPEDRLARGSGSRRTASGLAWAQLGGGTLVPAGSFGTLGVGIWFLRRFGLPLREVAERLLSLSLLNTAVDALALMLFGVGLAVGLFQGSQDPALTLLPAGVAAFGLAGALLLARRLEVRARAGARTRARRAAALDAVAEAVEDVDRFIFHGERAKSVLGAVAYLGFDLLVLWTAFLGIHASNLPSLGVVAMAYIIGALGGSLPFIPAGIGAVGGIAGMLVVYGVQRDQAVAAVVVYQAVSLLVPLIGGTIAFLLLRRHLEPVAGVAV